MPDLNPSHLDLQATAKQIMQQYGFEPDFPPQVPQQLADLKAHPPQIAPASDIRDLRNLLWSSIDNDTSRDLDQIEVAERVANGDVKILIGIADVDAFAAKQTPIDQHAARETTTVYTGVRNFPMLDRKSTRLNSSHPSISYAVFCLKKKKLYRVRNGFYFSVVSGIRTFEIDNFATSQDSPKSASSCL